MLSGIVEVDETSVGGASKYKKGLKNMRGEGTHRRPELLVNHTQRDSSLGRGVQVREGV
jgi:hypothetical protein